MKTHFDWQTEESDQKNSTELADKNPSSLGRRPGCWVFTLLIAVIIAGSLAWLAYDTQSEAVAGVGEDVLLALELERQAIEKGDEELFSEL